jgi:membrane fusion protein (multidrug efflux system)
MADHSWNLWLNQRTKYWANVSDGRKSEPTMKATETATSGNEIRGPKTEARNKAEATKAETLTATSTGTSPISEVDPAAQSGTSRHKHFATVFAGAAALLATVFGGWSYWDYARTWVRTDNAYVAAHLHTVSARVAGTIQEVLVEENQTVAAGAILARLDPRDFEIRVQQADSQVAQSHAQLRQADAKVAEARAQAAREEARTGKCRLDLERAKALFEGGSGAISKQELDQAQAESDAAEAALKAAQSTIASAQALVRAAEAQEKAVLANLEDARQQLSYTAIHAPASGRIGRKNAESGNRVQPGQGLLALVQPDVWVTANFKETQLARMKPGQRVEIRLDAFPGRVFTGKIDSLSPATGAQFALLPPDNATGNFTKIVQRVPVKIVFEQQDLGDCEGRIVPGMSAVVEVNVRG